MLKSQSYPGSGKLSGKKWTGKMAIAGLLLCWWAALINTDSTVPTGAQERIHNGLQASNPEKYLSYLVRDTIEHEIDAEAKDESLWCYRKLEDKDGKRRSYKACESKGAQIERLLAVNGRPLDEKQREAENQRIEKLLGSKRELRKQARQQREDGKQATHLVTASWVAGITGRKM